LVNIADTLLPAQTFDPFAGEAELKDGAVGSDTTAIVWDAQEVLLQVPSYLTK